MPRELAGQRLAASYKSHSCVCEPERTTVCPPGQDPMKCSNWNNKQRHQMWLGISESPGEPMADIYWAALNTTALTERSILHLFAMWKPWIDQIGLFFPPVDPSHCTLNYDRSDADPYAEFFFANVLGKHWTRTSSGLVCGLEGVANAVSLTSDQETWYTLAGAAYPHISLALSPHHQAKRLGSHG